MEKIKQMEATEAELVNQFVTTFSQLTKGLQSGNLTYNQQVVLVNALGSIFKHYVTGHRATVSAHQAVLQAKNAAKAKSS